MKLGAVALVAASGAAFAGGGGGHAVIPAWRVHVAAPAGGSFLTVQEAWATRDDRPTLLANWRISTQRPEAVAVADPALAGQGDELIRVVEDSAQGATDVRTASGEHYAIPGAPATRDARYYDLAPGIASVAQTDKGAIVRRYDRGAATPTWEQSLAAPFGVLVASVVGWLGHDDAVVALVGDAHTLLVAVHWPDGAARRIADVATGQGAFAVAARARLVAVLEPTDRCSSCAHVEVLDVATGRALRAFDLPSDAAIWPRDGGATFGFDGAELWGYSYVPPRGRSDMPIGAQHHAERCAYEVYDARTGTRLRTLATATGEWAKLSAGCATRALWPTLDGGALAFSVTDARNAAVVKFPSAP